MYQFAERIYRTELRICNFFLRTIPFVALLLFANTIISQNGSFNWEDLGIADEGAIPSGTMLTSTCGEHTVTIDWEIVTDGGSFVPFSGTDFVSYETNSEVLGEIGDIILGFDNEDQDPDDRIILTFTFDPPICGAFIAVADVDFGFTGWQDAVEIYVDGVNLVNMPGNIASTGGCVELDDEDFMTGWEGVCPASAANPIATLQTFYPCDENVCITEWRVEYFSSDDDIGIDGPEGQRINIPDIDFAKPPDELLSEVIGFEVTCNGLSDGAATVEAVGGQPPYTYEWDNGEITQTALMLDAGLHTVTVTDDNGCFLELSLEILEPDLLTCEISLTSGVECNGESNGVATVSGIGGTPPYTFEWDTGEMSGVSTMLDAGLHMATVTDANDCTAVCELLITEPDVLECSAITTDATDCGVNDGTITVTPSGGTPNYSYSIDGVFFSNTTGVFTDLMPGSYIPVVMDMNGCIALCDPVVIGAPDVPICTITVDQAVSCASFSDGAITVVGSDGSGNYEFSLDNVDFSNTSGIFTGLPGGIVTVFVRNAENPSCVTTCTATIDEPDPLSCVALPVSPVSCNGFSDGSATVIISGGTSPFNILWDNGETAETATMLNAGSHMVIVVDANNCVTNCFVTITEPETLTCVVDLENNVSCNGFGDGSATAVPSGGTAPFSYLWSNGQITETATNLSPGNNSVTVTDANMCITNCSIEISEPEILTCTAVSSDASDCGVNDGTIMITPVGGTPAYMYSFNGGPFDNTTGTFSSLSPGTYVLMVQDANGCVTDCEATVGAPDVPACSVEVNNDVSCNGFNDAAITVTGSGGSGNYEYSLDNNDFSNITGIFTNLPGGAVTVFIRNAENPSCVSSCSALIAEPDELICDPMFISNPLCNGDLNGSASVAVSGGTAPYNYQWTSGELGPTATMLGTGINFVTITDANDCEVICDVTLLEPEILTCDVIDVVNVSCFGELDGNALAMVTGGTMPYTYAWSNGETTETAAMLGAMAHSVTITDANNCEVMCSITITEPDLLTCSTVATDASDCGVNDGSIVVTALGGTMPYSYSLDGIFFSNTDGIFSALMPGSYIITVMDENGCTTTCTAVIDAPDVPTCTVVLDEAVSCNGFSDGQITVTGSGGSGNFEYSLDNIDYSNTTGIFTNLPAGMVTVFVRNAENPSCVSSCMITITEPEILTCMTSLESNVSCFGFFDGSASVEAMGGISPYTYAWDNGEMGSTATTLGTGTHMVTVTDANDCVIVCDIFIAQPNDLTCMINLNDNVSCAGFVDGTATAVISGGTVPYSYLWDNGETTAMATMLDAGLHVVEVVDANGCEISCSITITEPDPLTCSAVSSDATDCGVNDGTITVTPTGGTAPFSFSIDGVDFTNTTGMFTGLMPGSYNIDVLDVNMCATNCSTVITAPNVPSCTVAVDQDVSCNGFSDAQITITGMGGSGNFEYSLDNIDYSNVTGIFTGLSGGSITVFVRNTDSPNCISSCSTVIQEPEELNCDPMFISDPLCFGDLNGSASVSATGGIMPYTYEWENGEVTATATMLGTGMHSVTVTDANDCEVVCSIILSEPDELICEDVFSTEPNCMGFEDGSILAVGIGGTLPYTFTLGGEENNDGLFTGLGQGLYQIQITDANGCISICRPVILTDPVLLSCSTTTTDATDCGINDGTITITPAGGTGPFLYSIDGVDFTNDSGVFTDLMPGSYIVTVIDENLCLTTCSAIIGAPNVPSCSIEVNQQVSCFGFSDAEITVTGSGGSGNFEYSLDNIDFSNTSGIFGGLPVGPVTVFVRNAENISCVSSCSVEITQPEVLQCFTEEILPVSCEGISNGVDDGFGRSFAVGGTMPYSYLWDTGATTANAGNLGAGFHFVTITDANGCFDICSVEITNEVCDVCISLIKTSDIDLGIDNIATPGDIINYSYEVTNCGELTLFDVEIGEDQNIFSGTGNLPVPTMVVPIDLTVGETGTASATYAITQEDIDAGIVINQAFATGTGPNGEQAMDVSDDGNPLNGDDDPTEQDIEDDPCINLIKSSSINLGPDNIATPGDIITYSYLISNCGNVTLLNLNLEEDGNFFTGTGTLPVPSSPSPIVIEPNELATATATYAITQEDIDAGGVVNQAEVSGETLMGEMVSDLSDSGNPLDDTGGPDDPTDQDIPDAPCIELIKTSTLDLGDDGISTIGDMITYTYEVINCGNVTLNNLSVSEDPAFFTGTGMLPVPSPVIPDVLLPGENAFASATYAITQDDINAQVVTNQALALGDGPDGETVEDLSDSGNPLDDMGTDDDPTDTEVPAFLCIEVIKSSSLDNGANDFSDAGDIINYSYSVTNCSAVTLFNVNLVEDPSLFTGTGILPVPSAVVPSTLEPGETGTATSEYIVTQDDIDEWVVFNQAIGTGEDIMGDMVSDLSDSGNPLDDMGTDDDPTITVLGPCPSFACNAVINVSLGPDCETLVVADNVLEGGSDPFVNSFLLELFDEQGNLIPDNIVTFDHIGDEITAVLTSACDSLSCWGFVVVEDKHEPEIFCDCPPNAWLTNPDCHKTCLQMDELISGNLGQPTIIENCYDSRAVLSGYKINDGADCGEYIVEQTWAIHVADDYGNFQNTGEVCVSEQYVFAVDIDEVNIPFVDITIECDEVNSTDPFHPDNTGYPILGDEILDGDIQSNSFCNLNAYFTDIELEACNDSDNQGLECADFKKVVRTWTVLDWCNNETSVFNQVLKIIDTTAPQIEASDILVSVDPWQCSGELWMIGDNVPMIHDNCSSGLDWWISSTNSGALLVDANGNPNGGIKKHALGIPKGTWSFTISTQDCCGNIGSTDIEVRVEDDTPPVPVAHLNIIVGLTSSGSPGDEGKAKLFVEDINNGSFDMCSDVAVEIRRENDVCGINGNRTYSSLIPSSCDDDYSSGDFDQGAFVSFCCDDEHADGDGDGTEDGLVRVWMRVWDDANMDGVFGSYEIDNGKCVLLDNYNETWIYVKVENKAPVLLTCPPDMTIPCDWDHTDLGITGEAIATSTCGIADVEYSDWGDIECGSGIITREWSVVGFEDVMCSQIITVVSDGNLSLNVNCPSPDAVVVNCDDYEIPEPWFGAAACNLAGISSTIDTFWFEADACYKVIKEWTIVDWCSGDEYTCSFTLTMLDDQAPSVTCQDTCIAVDDYWDTDNDGNYCELANNIVITNQAGATDIGACPSEWIKWTIEIDYWNDGIIEDEKSSFLPHTSPDYIAPTQMGQAISVTLNKDLASAAWAFHRIKWKAHDGCGNIDQCEQIVEIADKKAPTPYCVGISTAIMDESAGNLVELWATDFNVGTFDNCTAPQNILYTFKGVPPVANKLDQVHYFDASGERTLGAYEGGYPVQKWNPDTKSSATKFVGTSWCGENEIEVSAWDEKFNTDFCNVILFISGHACEETICGNCYSDNIMSNVVGFSFEDNKTYCFDIGENDKSEVELESAIGEIEALAVNPNNKNELIYNAFGNLYTGTFDGGNIIPVGNLGISGVLSGLDFTDSGNVYGVGKTSGFVYTIDLNNGSGLNLFSLTDQPAMPTDIAVSADDSEFYISGEEIICQYDDSGNLVDCYSVVTDGEIIGGMAYDACGLIYYCTETGKLYKFDLEDYSSIFILEMGINCNDLDNLNAEEIYSIPYFIEEDCETGQIFGAIGPDGFGYSPIGCQGDGDDCDSLFPFANVAGNVYTEAGEMVADVRIDVNSAQAGYPRSYQTIENGAFAFQDNPMYTNYQIQGFKDNGHLNGVSTLDLVMIQRHILGLQILDSGYKLIAADINNDQQVSSIDLVELRKLILGVYSQLPDNTSWRFVNESVIPSSVNPWPFVEIRNIENLDQDMMQEDLIGVKIGDVNNSVVANITSIPTESRSARKLDIQVHRSNDYLIFSAGHNFEAIYGMQFSLEKCTGLGKIQAAGLQVDINNFALVKEDVLNFSFSNDLGISLESGTELFRIQVSDMPALANDRHLKAEAYQGNNLEIIGVNLRLTNEYSLFQNEPNPFSEFTRIGFVIPKEEIVSLTIFDASGKTILYRSEQFAAGTNNFIIDAEAIESYSGVLVYELQTESFVERKKMIFLK